MESAWRIGAALAATIVLGALGGQVLLYRAAWSDRCDDLPGAFDRLRTMLRETGLTLWVALGWLRSQHTMADPPGRRTAVLVHGFAASPASLRPLARRLRRDGWSVVAPALGRWWPNLEGAAARLATQLDRLQDHRAAGDMVVVAYGLGGLATRLALARTPRLARDLRLVMTLGTPHDGTTACAALRLGPFRQDVRPDSPAMRALAATRLPAGVEAIAIASPADAVVVPAERSRWREGCTVSVAGHGHLFLLVSPTVQEIVAENLADVSPPAVADHVG